MRFVRPAARGADLSRWVARWLPRRWWYSAALVLVLGSIATQLLAKHHAGIGMMIGARAGAKRVEWERRGQAGDWDARHRERQWQNAFWHAQRADAWGGVSFGMAVLAAAFWGLSSMRREAGRYGVLIALMALYLLLVALVI